jgi:zona occludens toxin (predicted ATPase)
VGEYERVRVVRENVEPFTTGTPADSAHDSWKFPADDASQIEICVIVSDVVIDHVPSDDSAIEFDDGAANVGALRVVFVDAFAVPAAPGSPVCSFTNGLTAEYAVER